MRPQAVRRFLGAFGLLLLEASASCIGVPVERRRVNHIVATGWTSDGEPVALAQKVRLGRTAYMMSPEGPGVFEHSENGPLLLVRGGQEMPLEIPYPGSGFAVENAAARPGGGGFLVLVRGNPNGIVGQSRWLCLLIGLDGSVRECNAPSGYQFESFSYYLAPNAREIRFRRKAEPGFRFEALDAETGALTALAEKFLTLKLLSGPETPCDMSYARLSPGQDRYAVACFVREEGRILSGIWIIRPGGVRELIYEFTDASIRPPTFRSDRTRLEDMVTWPREEYSLAWSQDEKHVYWCGGRGARGVLLSFDGAPPRIHKPCLRLAGFSPDGTRLAGALDDGLATWDVQ